MLEDIQDVDPVCDGEDCEQPLPADPALVFRSDAGERRAYECQCGTVTITAVRDGSR